MTQSRHFRRWAAVLFCLALLRLASGEVMLKEETIGGHTAYRLENERVALLISPARGGAVTSYRDKHGGNVELIHQAPLTGLCLDHFQCQRWPGEMLDTPYRAKVVKKSADECIVQASYTVRGEWHGAQFPRLEGLLLEKTYALRAGSPALECRVKLTAPPKASKLFAYWLQNVFFAGGQYDKETDVSFRPSARGVRRKSLGEPGLTGREEWLRDFTDGWMALLDTKARTGLVVLSDYNAVSVLYANGGNVSLEPMYRIRYLPPGASVEYVTQIVPVAGLDNVVAACEDYVVGYRMASDGKGSGTVELAAVRSVHAPRRLTLAAKVASVDEPDRAVSLPPAVLDNLANAPQAKKLAFTGAGPDPLVLRVRTAAELASGKKAERAFEDYFNGAYQWGENIKTDMITPYYVGERPAQELSLHKPKPLRLRPGGRYNVWYVQGFLDDLYGLTPALRLMFGYRGGRTVWRRAFVSYNGAFGSRLSAFPYDYEELLAYNLVILGGAKRDALNDIGIEMLTDYLQAGGGMVVLGGPMAYSFSGLAGSKLEAMWPVASPDKPFAIHDVRSAAIQVAQEETFLEDLDWSPKPRVRYLHQVTVKPWGKTVLTVAGKPFLVIGTKDRARVACILGAPMGTVDRGTTPFWQWDDWRYLLRQLCWWVGHNDHHFK